MGRIVYFSSVSENTHRFVGKLGFEAQRIPLRSTEATCGSIVRTSWSSSPTAAATAAAPSPNR